MASVAVLLCTYNGSPFLSQQLASFEAQHFEQSSGIDVVDVHASDDGSTDGTQALLQQWAGAPGCRLASFRSGPQRGHTANFLSLIHAPDIKGDYYAFADQDDTWDADKLARAVAVLNNVSSETPALYCARTRSISATGQVSGESPLFPRPPGFRNALLQNIAGGNTMVMNAAARALVCRAGEVEVPAHDWWVYLLVSGAGGRVIYDPAPCLSYRQHDNNAVGDSLGSRARIRRYRGFLRGRNRNWYAQNSVALEANAELLTEQNRRTLTLFRRTREGSLIQRLHALAQSGVYAQTFSGNLGLYTATLLKKI